MVIHFYFLFFIISFTNMMLIVITADTKDVKPKYVRHVDAVHDFCTSYVSPVVAAIALFLVPIVIIWGV